MIGALVVFVLALIVLIVIASTRNDRHHGRRPYRPHPYHPHHHHRDNVVLPFCEHTYHGCCPGTTTPKVDRYGSNCRWY